VTLKIVLLLPCVLLLAGCASTGQKSDVLNPTGGSFDQHLNVTPVNLPAFPEGLPIGTPGFCKSPYAPTSGLVDVRGFATGDKVVDPYTNKTFTVPDFTGKE
jgi:hypothetical protein